MKCYTEKQSFMQLITRKPPINKEILPALVLDWLCYWNKEALTRINNCKNEHLRSKYFLQTWMKRLQKMQISLHDKLNSDLI